MATLEEMQDNNIASVKKMIEDLAQVKINMDNLVAENNKLQMQLNNVQHCINATRTTEPTEFNHGWVRCLDMIQAAKDSIKPLYGMPNGQDH